MTDLLRQIGRVARLALNLWRDHPAEMLSLTARRVFVGRQAAADYLDRVERSRRRNRYRLEREAVGPNGWTCHVCGHYRPDALIGVRSSERKFGIAAVPIRQNVRYCIDRPECVEGSRKVTWLP